MVNRREFIQAGAIAAVPLAAGAGLLFGDSQKAQASPPRTPLHTVVYDERFADSEAFAHEARQLGLKTSAIRGDVTDLWYHDLYHRWKKGPVAIAGLTTVDALFCLETFGNDAGLRLVLRAEHRPGDGLVEHRLMGPQALVKTAALDQCGGNWSGRMAHLVNACPATRKGRIEATAFSQVNAGRASDQPMLVSWMLAPAKHRSWV